MFLSLWSVVTRSGPLIWWNGEFGYFDELGP